MSTVVARAISILGHPLLLVPLVALLLLLTQGQAKDALMVSLGLVAVGGVVMTWSAWQVRRGRWQHVDASNTDERKSLNRFLLVVLLIGAAASALLGKQALLTLALALSAVIVCAALVSARWCKLSLHVSFAVFAAILLGQAHLRAGIAALVFAALLAWSRLHLQRHVPRDLAAGAMAGLLAGLAFLELSPHLSP